VRPKSKTRYFTTYEKLSRIHHQAQFEVDCTGGILGGFKVVKHLTILDRDFVEFTIIEAKAEGTV
jgi:hypothetical protein